MAEECAENKGRWRLTNFKGQQMTATCFGYASMALSAWQDLVRRIEWARELGITGNEPAALLLVDEAANVARMIAYGVLCGDITTAVEAADADAVTSAPPKEMEPF